MGKSSAERRVVRTILVLRLQLCAYCVVLESDGAGLGVHAMAAQTQPHAIRGRGKKRDPAAERHGNDAVIAPAEADLTHGHGYRLFSPRIDAICSKKPVSSKASSGFPLVTIAGRTYLPFSRNTVTVPILKKF